MLAAVALASSADTFNLKRIPKVGQTYTYTLKMEFDFEGDVVKFQGEHVETVVELKEKGLFVVEQDMLNAVMIMDGEEESMEEQPSIRVTMYPDGEIAEPNPEHEDSDVFAPSSLVADMGLRLDKDSYKVGDKWTHEVPANEEDETPASRLDVEVVARERVQGIDSIRLKFSSVETEGSEPTSAEGSLWIDPVDGAVVKVDMTTNTVLTRLLIERKS